jgi:hypothetical protein
MIINTLSENCKLTIEYDSFNLSMVLLSPNRKKTLIDVTN